MNARAVERAEAELHDLHARTVGNFGLAAVALGAAIVGSRVLPEIAVPLLVGGLAMVALGVRTLVARSLLVEDLAADRDAYLIPEVHRLALRAASRDHREVLASAIRHLLEPAMCGPSGRVAANRDVLVEIADALLDDRLTLDPAAAVALDRLLTGAEGGMFDPGLPVDELRSRLRRILAAFSAA
jgi:hypothetical protein